MKSLPKTFATNSTIVDEYNLTNTYQAYSKIAPTKRGGARESMSDAKNLFIRAALDKKFSASGSLTEAWRVGIAIFDGCCYLCGERIYTKTGETVSNTVIQADHIVPPSRGGTISAGNLLAAHSICNDLKGDILIEEFLQDFPQQLEKVRNFQKFYNYSAPDTEVFECERKRIIEIWETAMSQI